MRNGKEKEGGLLFLDSGAFSLYANNARAKKHEAAYERAGEYDYYDSPAFWQYVDAYAAFIKAHADVIDYYANVDVLYNPGRTWAVQEYLEREHGLRPVPVVHCGTGMEWVRHYVSRGHDYVGVGGYAQGVGRDTILAWTTRLFQEVCPPPSCLPAVRLHGFAMTSYELMVRFPFYSVDSATWTKVAAFGNILVPHRRRGSFVFDTDPYVICVSDDSPQTKVLGKHYRTLNAAERAVVAGWLDEVGVPFGHAAPDGGVAEYGVSNRHSERKIANLLFFERLRESLPDWPWPFRVARRGGLGLGD